MFNTYRYPIPVSSRFCLKLPSKRPTVGKFWTPQNPIDSNCLRKKSIRRKGSVPHTPARTGTFFTTYIIISSASARDDFKRDIRAGKVFHYEFDLSVFKFYSLVSLPNQEIEYLNFYFSCISWRNQLDHREIWII